MPLWQPRWRWQCQCLLPAAYCLPCCRCWSACLAVIVVLINELDGSLRNQLVCSLAFVSSRLAFKICCSTWAWISSWYLGACIAYRVSCISQTIFALWLPSLLAATASRPDNHNILRQLPLAGKVTRAVESSVLNVNRAERRWTPSPTAQMRDKIHCSLLENVLFIIGKSTLNCWDRMRCYGGRLYCWLYNIHTLLSNWSVPSLIIADCGLPSRRV